MGEKKWNPWCFFSVILLLILVWIGGCASRDDEVNTLRQQRDDAQVHVNSCFEKLNEIEHFKQ